jgi:spectinomycin phosphotransferase
MLSPNTRIDVGLLRDALADQYPGPAAAPVFQPLGLDSWCYRWGDLWVSVRRDLLGHVPQAYAGAARLRAAGLDFVLAPLAGADGQVVRQVHGFPVVVFPYLPVEQVGDGLTPAEAGEVAEMLRRLHTHPVAAGLPVEDFTLPFDQLLLAALDRALSQDAAGPFAARLRRLLARHRTRVLDLRAEAAELAARLPGGTPYVVTHGDLNVENVLRCRGRLLLADWGSAAAGPAERDGFHVDRVFGLGTGGDPDLLRFYDLWWQLSEIADYTDILTQADTDDAHTRGAWLALLTFCPDGRTVGAGDPAVTA